MIRSEPGVKAVSWSDVLESQSRPASIARASTAPLRKSQRTCNFIAAWPPLALLLTVEMLSRGTAGPPAATQAPEAPTSDAPAEKAVQPPEAPRPARSTPALKPLSGGRPGSIPAHVLAELGTLDRMPGARVAAVAHRYDVSERSVRRAVARHRQNHTEHADRTETVA